MINALKRAIRKSPILYKLAYGAMICLKVPFLLLFRVKPILQTRLTGGRKVVIFYLNYPAHYALFEPIPDKLSEKYLVYILCYFPKREHELKGLSPRVRVLYGCSDALIGLLRADIYVTPREDEKVFPRRASRVLFVHSLMNSEGLYAEGDYDNYDYIYCAGSHQMEEFVQLFRERRSRPKYLIPGGYPKLSRQIARAQPLSPREIAGPPVVIYAPTYYNEFNRSIASLERFGAEIIARLIDGGYKVVFRPHPLNFNNEGRAAIEAIVEKFRGEERFELDRSSDYFGVYSRTDMMVTDLSGTGFTYAFIFGRPVLFFAHNAEAERTLKALREERRSDIGGVVRSLDEIAPKVRSIVENYPSYRGKIEKFRDETIYNVHDSADYFLAHVGDIVNRRKHPADWVAAGG